MADNSTLYTYMGEASWWKLREQFKRKVPTIVSPIYIAQILGMKEGSAKSSIIPPLRKVGIIDDNGNPTDLAYEWRDDAQYASVCQKIIDKCYPEALKDIYHDKNQDLTGLVTWFMNSNRLGKSAAEKYASFYELLLRANVSEQSAKKTTSQTQPNVKQLTTPKKDTKAKPDEVTSKVITSESPINEIDRGGSSKEVAPNFNISSIPQLHINIQLHISPESNAEQIDKIFESMARHLKSFATQDN